MKKDRRNFLKVMGVAAAGAGILPVVKATGMHSKKQETIQCDPTTLDYYGQGPFYTADAPNIVSGMLADENEPGQRIVISGSLFAQDCLTKIPNALLDLWHANDAGAYDNEGYELRGKIYTDDNGDYSYETILPGKYLNGASFRPRHIHIKASAEGYNSLITQLYFEGDTDIPGDAAASITSGVYDASDRIIPMTLNEETNKLEGQFDLILIDPTLGVNEESLHIHFGMINSCDPNPVVDESQLKFSVFKNSKVNISCYSPSGEYVSRLVNSKMKKGKYEVKFNPREFGIPKGSFILSLAVNGMSVHHKKIEIV